MQNSVKTERVSTTIVGTILGETVTINYDNLLGVKVKAINANCTIDMVGTGTPIQQGTYINIRYDEGGNKNVQVNGKKTVEELAALIIAIETELETILI
jgi:hypothetical protein